MIDTYVEYGQSFVDYISSTETVVEPPFEEFSTQSIILSDGTSHELIAADDVDPTSCSVEEPVDAPSDVPSDDNPSSGLSITNQRSLGNVIAVVAVATFSFVMK